jgi:hypothetical protein
LAGLSAKIVLQTDNVRFIRWLLSVGMLPYLGHDPPTIKANKPVPLTLCQTDCLSNANLGAFGFHVRHTGSHGNCSSNGSPDFPHQLMILQILR